MKEWNKLDAEIRNLQSPSKFRTDENSSVDVLNM